MKRAVLLSTLSLVSCGSGAYGFARSYVALSDEEPFMERASDATYEDVRRSPDRFQNTHVAWFGVVTHVGPSDAEGRSMVALTHRIHQSRHLCSDETESSCRVTISDRASGPFSARLAMSPEDHEGQNRLWTGSLLKVYGAATGEYDEQGGPVLRAEFYRHWPRGYYVTTGAARAMRR